MNYYIGYLRNPKDTMENGFKEKLEFEVLLKQKDDEIREVTTNSKVFLINGNETIDGKKIIETNCLLVGRIGKELSYEKAKEFLKHQGIRYLQNIYYYIEATSNFAITKTLEYQEMEEKFRKETRR